MITAIYQLRDHGFKHTETTSSYVTYRKLVGEDTWEVIEHYGEYVVKKNGILKDWFDCIGELWDYLTTNKLI